MEGGGGPALCYQLGVTGCCRRGWQRPCAAELGYVQWSLVVDLDRGACPTTRRLTPRRKPRPTAQGPPPKGSPNTRRRAARRGSATHVEAPHRQPPRQQQRQLVTCSAPPSVAADKSSGCLGKGGDGRLGYEAALSRTSSPRARPQHLSVVRQDGCSAARVLSVPQPAGGRQVHAPGWASMGVGGRGAWAGPTSGRTTPEREGRSCPVQT